MRNIDALAIRRTRKAGLDVMYLPGIGPRTASELVIGIDIADFPDHHYLASYCGIAPRNRRSSTSISSVSASKVGQQEAQELAHILMQLAGAQPQPLRRVLPQVPRTRHVPWRGKGSSDLRNHAG